MHSKNTKPVIEKDNRKTILELCGKVELRYTLEEFLEFRRKDIPTESDLSIHTIKKLLLAKKHQSKHQI
jgi:hypothetical protein